MRRLIPYLLGALRVVNVSGYEWGPGALDVYTDSDWSGGVRNPKPTAGGAVIHGHDNTDLVN